MRCLTPNRSGLITKFADKGGVDAHGYAHNTDGDKGEERGHHGGLLAAIARVVPGGHGGSGSSGSGTGGIDRANPRAVASMAKYARHRRLSYNHGAPLTTTSGLPTDKRQGDSTLAAKLRKRQEISSRQINSRKSARLLASAIYYTLKPHNAHGESLPFRAAIVDSVLFTCTPACLLSILAISSFKSSVVPTPTPFSARAPQLLSKPGICSAAVALSIGRRACRYSLMELGLVSNNCGMSSRRSTRRSVRIVTRCSTVYPRTLPLAPDPVEAR